MRKFIKVVVASIAALVMSASLLGAQNQESINKEIFDKVYSAVKSDIDKPMPELVTKIALQFLGTEYVAGTLEKEPEALQMYLDKTDCILFVELCSCLAMTYKGLSIEQAGDGKIYTVGGPLSVKKAKPSYELLCHNIQNMRYRLGTIDGYSSRIHYTSEWILQNQTNGIMTEFTATIGKEHPQKFSYMSKHPASYKQLKNSPKEVEKIMGYEKHLEEQAPYYIITQEDLRKPEVIAKIHSGDIITFISTVDGLDLAHVAIAYEHDGQMHFIHASSAAMKVIIEPKTLADYAKNGLRVSRFNF